MAHLTALALIMGISFVGDLLSRILPFPVPGSIYGLILMLLLLLCGLVKLERVRTVGNFFISLMPLMFIAPAVDLMASVDSFRDFLLPMTIICAVSTLVVMVVTGRVSQAIIRRTQATAAHRKDVSHE